MLQSLDNESYAGARHGAWMFIKIDVFIQSVKAKNPVSLATSQGDSVAERIWSACVQELRARTKTLVQGCVIQYPD